MRTQRTRTQLVRRNFALVELDRRDIEQTGPAHQPFSFLNLRIAARALASVMIRLHTWRLSFVSRGSDVFACARGSGQRLFGFFGAPPKHGRSETCHRQHPAPRTLETPYSCGKHRTNHQLTDTRVSAALEGALLQRDDVGDESAGDPVRPALAHRRWPLVPGGKRRPLIAVELCQEFPHEDNADQNVA